MEVDSEIYDGRLWTARNWGQQSLYLMYQKYLATVAIIASLEFMACTQSWHPRDTNWKGYVVKHNYVN